MLDLLAKAEVLVLDLLAKAEVLVLDLLAKAEVLVLDLLARAEVLVLDLLAKAEVLVLDLLARAEVLVLDLFVFIAITFFRNNPFKQFKSLKCKYKKLQFCLRNDSIECKQTKVMPSTTML